MSGLEILTTYPIAAKVVKDWILSQMLESFKDESVPDSFKDFIFQQGLEDDKISVMIDANPRFLFDVFDDCDIIIETIVFPDKTFSCKIGKEATTNSWKTRKESEMFAIEAAFQILNNRIEDENK